MMKKGLLAIVVCLAFGRMQMAFADVRLLVFPRISQAHSPLQPPGESAADRFQTLFALTNTGRRSSSLVISAFGADGLFISGPGIRNPVSMILPPGNQVAKYAHELFGEGIRGEIAWVEVLANGGEVEGIYLTSDTSLSVLTGAPALRAEEAARELVLPHAGSDRFLKIREKTEIDVINPNDVPVDVEVQLWPEYGSDNPYVDKAPLHATIPARGKIQREVDTGEGDGYLKIVSGRPVLASETLVSNTIAEGRDERTFSLTATNAVAPATALHKPYDIAMQPHATGGDWYTRALFISPNLPENPLPLDFELLLWNSNSTEARRESFQISPGQKLTLDLSDIPQLDTDGTKGSLSYEIVRSSKRRDAKLLEFTEVGVKAMAADPPRYFRILIPPVRPEREAVLEHVEVGPAGPAKTLATDIIVRDGRIPTARSHSSRKNHLNFELYSPEGDRLEKGKLELRPGQKAMLPLTTIFPKMKVPQFGGYVRIRGSSPFQSLSVYSVVEADKVLAASMIPHTIPISSPEAVTAPLTAFIPFHDNHNVPAVPEPSTLSLTVAGILALAAYGLRRRRRSSRRRSL